MTSPTHRFKRAIAVLAFAAFAFPAFADYKLQTGDALEFTAAGAPDLLARATIDGEGMIALPIVGEVKASGRLLSEVRLTVQERMASKVYRRRNADGRETPIVFSPDEINLSIASYRPIYLSGDVSKPGEQAFRLGLTVRQAVSLAGGYDIMRFRMNNPFLEQSDLRGQFDNLWIQHEKERIAVARMNAELANGQSFELAAGENGATPVPAVVLAPIHATEVERFRTRKAAFAREKQSLERAIQKEGDRVAAVTAQQKAGQAGSELDNQELDRLDELYKKGLMPVTRIVEARRMILLSSTRALELTSQKTQIERIRDDLTSRLDQLDDQRRATILADLQEAQVRLAGVRAQIQSVSEKLAYTGMVRSQLVRGDGGAPEILIIRKNDQGDARVLADEETEVMPGDVIEIALKGMTAPPAVAAR